jgi:hypothetical protein
MLRRHRRRGSMRQEKNFREVAFTASILSARSDRYLQARRSSPVLPLACFRKILLRGATKSCHLECMQRVDAQGSLDSGRTMRHRRGVTRLIASTPRDLVMLPLGGQNLLCVYTCGSFWIA